MLRRCLASVLSLALVVGTISIAPKEVKAVDRSTPWKLSTNRPAYSSSTNGGDIATFATDERLGTQWGAAANKADQWLDIDLGGKADISKVVIDWQNNASYGVSYEVLTSNDEISWKSVYSTTNGTGGQEKQVLRTDGTVDYTYYEDVLSTDSANAYKLTASNGRYVRVLIHYSKSQSGSGNKIDGWGASIRELEVYGIGDNDCIDPVSDAPNLALNKNVEVSSHSTPWWASKPLDGSNAVDDDYESYWLSEGNDDVASKCNQTLTVDLGKKYTIGRVLLQWQTEYGNIWDLQVSADGEHFDTVYRQLHGNGEDEEIRIYAENVRYVRMQGILMGRGSGYSIRELKVYEYENGDPKTTYDIPDIPEKKIEKMGQGSYVIDDGALLQPREPKYITDNAGVPIPSNDWWTSIIYTKYSDVMPALPMAYKYSATGLGMYYADGAYTRSDNGGMGCDSRFFDLTLGASNVVGKASAKLDGYGDWSVDAVFSDNDTPKMRSTMTKGSPFIYTTFSDPNAVELNVNNLVKFMDKNGNEIITQDGVAVNIDHFAVESKNESEAPGDGNKIQYHYYGVYMPANSTVVKVGNKLKIKLGSGGNYLTIGALCVDEAVPLHSNENGNEAANKMDNAARTELEYMYKFAYSVITDTTVSYDYNEQTAKCTTTYDVTTSQKRTGTGIGNTTLMCMLPHQWKYTSASYVTTGGKAKIYPSVRGDMRIHEGNNFSFSQKFNGVLPQYTSPDESDSFNKEWTKKYLDQFTDTTLKSYWVADPYWQGKKSHPIAMGIMIADQLGEYETRDKLLDVLKKIMKNWLTYDGDEDYPYYMYYHTSWGAVSGDGGDHGMAINLSDHHFLWAYFIFPAAILASYDKSFIEDYGDMIEFLIRDCMNPDKDDLLLPFMRNFDVYEGHSWAGGYGDNNSGNNQESASEATFSWAGLYLWGLVTGQKKYRDAGIWGYTSEIDAIEQYWFNMDQGTGYDSHNWPSDYGQNVYGDENCDVLPYTGMVWGLGYTNGTYFSGNPCCIMGIHLLPVTPAITYMGYRPETVDKIWKDYRKIQEAYQAKMQREGATDPEGWFHILWPFMSLSDPEGAARTWKEEYESHINQNGDYVGGVLPNDEMFNSYWYIHNMCSKGLIDTSVWASNYTSYQIFSKTVNGNKKYTAEVWNPSDNDITVQFANANGNIGSVKVGPHATVSVDPTKNTDTTSQTEYVPYEARDKVLSVPGVIEAEDYDTNFGCEPTQNEQEGGYIGWIDDGDSMLYNIDVAEEADYVVEYRVQTTDKNKHSAIKLMTDNDDDYILTTDLQNNVEGWKNIKSDQTVHLKAGQYQMKLMLVDGGFNFNYIKIYKQGTKPPHAESDDLTKADLSDYPEIDLSNAKVIDVSSVANDNGAAANMIDDDLETRWESRQADPQFFTIELSQVQKVGGIQLFWEAAASKNYTIQASTDNQNWQTIFTRTGGNGGRDNLVPGTDAGLESISFNQAVDAKYIKLYSSKRATGYGVSVFEVKLFGEGEEQANQPTTKETTTKQVTTTKAETTTAEVTTTKAETTTAEPTTTAETTTKQETTTQEVTTTKEVTTVQPTTTKELIVPDAPTGLVVNKSGIVEWVAGANADTYNVYVNGTYVGNTPAKQFLIASYIEAEGTYTIEVKGVSKDGVEGPAASVSYEVKAETTTTAEETTTQQITTAQSTTKQTTTAQSTTDQSTTKQTTTAQSTTKQATTADVTNSTTTAQRTTEQQSTTEQKTTEQPVTVAPTEKPSEIATSNQGDEKATTLASLDDVEKAILKAKKDKDPAGSTYGKLQAKAKKSAKKANKITWKKQEGAVKYVIYGGNCGKKIKKLKVVKKNKFDSKKLKKGKYYKYIVVAVDKDDKVIAISKMIHAATKGGKVGNPKAIKLKKKKLTVYVGKTAKIKAKLTKPKKVKVKNHRKLSYESTDNTIAAVSKKGVVKGLKKGQCTVWVYAQNGIGKKITITVK